MFRESKIRGLQGWDKTMTPDAREREIIEKLDVFCRQKLKNLDELPDGEGEFKDSEKDFFMSIQFLLAALAESRDREKEWVDSYSKQTQQLVDSEKQVAALEAKLAEKDREINSFIRDFESDFVMDSGELVDVDHLWSPAVAHYKAMKALRPPTGEGE